MSMMLRINWAIWSILTTLVAAGTIAFWISTETKILPLTLAPGTSIEVSVFRLRPAPLNMEIWIKENSSNRQEFEKTRSGRHITGEDRFAYFQAPIVLNLTNLNSNKNYILNVKNVFGWKSDQVSREIGAIFDEINNSNNFQKIITLDNKARSQSRTINYRVTVLEVGDRLLNEQAEFVIQPPLGFKSGSYGYEHLWWFFLWPVYAFGLLVYLLILIPLTWRNWKRRELR